MKWFIKKKKEEWSVPPFTLRIMLHLNKKLSSLAAWLGQKTVGYSKRKKVTVLFLFCVAFATESFYVVWSSFQRSSVPSYTVTPIRVMPLLKESGPKTVAIPELKRIHRFKEYLDSVSRSGNGRRWRDSFLTTRPHLMDTILYLEGLYNEQFKNETNGKK